MSIVFRHYRNYDNPGVTALWNAALTTRGCCKAVKPFFLEIQWFCKPWFDRRGLTVAVDDELESKKQIIGAVLSGFGGTPDRKAIDHQRGVVSTLLVHPDYRRKGLGTRLLHSAEQYLFEQGTTDGRFGCNWERSPYCWGMLGSIMPAGVLRSMDGAQAFIEKQGYTPAERYEILTRPMTQSVSFGDPRFPHLRRKYEFRVSPRKVTTWFEEAQQGALETVVFELLETALERPVAEIRAGEMTQFTGRNQPPLAGLYGIQVKPEFRRQGLAKYLLAQTLQHLNDQLYQNVETVIPSSNSEARGLLTGMGFTTIDEGISYAKTLGAPR